MLAAAAAISRASAAGLLGCNTVSSPQTLLQVPHSFSWLYSSRVGMHIPIPRYRRMNVKQLCMLRVGKTTFRYTLQM